MTLLARAWVALCWLAMCLVALLVVLVCWPFVRPPVRRRGIAPAFRGCEAALAQRDYGDETDVVTEGGFAEPWPGIESIDAIRRANPQLTDMHAYAVAKARQRLAVR